MNSTYSDELHVSIPTLDYIKLNTGFDMIIEKGNKELAESTVISLTSKARDFLFVDKPLESQRAMSYLIKNNPTWTKAWESYVLRYIEATFNYGDESAWEKVPQTIKNAIYGGILRANYFTEDILNTIRTTDEVW